MYEISPLMSSEIFDFDKIFKVLVNSGFRLKLANFVEGLAFSPSEAQIPRAGGFALWREVCNARVGTRVAALLFGKRVATLASARNSNYSFNEFLVLANTLSQKISLATARKIFKKTLDIDEGFLYIVLVVVRGCGCSN